MQNYLDTKKEYHDCILFYRLGDFYEMFFEDAVTVSSELQLTLTGKSCGLKERAPMCGVPYHSADKYIGQLIERGYKVAVCEQMEDAADAKGLVRREVVQIVTPGTLMNQTLLNAAANNYLAAAFSGEGEEALAYCDISTGELVVMSFGSERRRSELIDEIIRIDTRELVVSEAAEEDWKHDLRQQTDVFLSELSPESFGRESSIRGICRQFGVNSPAGLGIPEDQAAVQALGGLLAYIFETQKKAMTQLTLPQVRSNADYCMMDRTAIRNLELTQTLYDGKIDGSLAGVLDDTRTAMGSRMLKKWIREPLVDPEQIRSRHDAVALAVEEYLLRNNVRDHLRRILDLERIAGRIASGGANARDLNSLKDSLQPLPELKSDLSVCGSSLLEELADRIDAMEDLRREIMLCIEEEPPVGIKEGGMIRPGYSSELDAVRSEAEESLEWIRSLEGRERERTGIKKLKVGFNRVFGYYIDIPKSYKDSIPEEYLRKQTLANSERYVTEDLKRMESIVLNVETRINGMEYDIFCRLREMLRDNVSRIQTTAQALAEIDVLASFAEVSDRSGYTRPKVDSGDTIEIQGGRHPVIEHGMDDGLFVANDLLLDERQHSLLLITGPNMAGKSTYMRQTALIVLMAQIGCFVPADYAHIGIVDRIFTRIGASDNLARGESTFYVEMSELAYILNTATSRSLIILDEIGRGTSTYDGLSIAWAVIRDLCSGRRRVRTLFATHYHELTALEDNVEGVCNMNVAVSENDGDVVFLHRIEPGSASRSYGIHVAKIAGVPERVLQDASEKLSRLEETAGERTETPLQPEQDPLPAPEAAGGSADADVKAAGSEEQLSFIQFQHHPVVEMIESIDLMNITPSGAIAVLERLKEAVRTS